MSLILQNKLPEEMTGPVRLPGVAPCAPDAWLRVDEAYGAQMAYRSALLAQKPQDVLWRSPNAHDAATEVLDEALAILPHHGFLVKNELVTCPDGRQVALERARPLWTLGHLVQEDICLLQKQGDQHVLTGAVLCFPANWRLADKVGRPLTDIHVPVTEYDSDLARRVQRLFDGVKAGRPMWRFNKLSYRDPDLHQPRRKADSNQGHFTRSERQCVVRMPRTDAVVFSIHTYVVQDEGGFRTPVW